MIQKPSMITMPAHPTNQWSRYGLPFEFIVLHYVGAVSTARNNGSYYGNTPNIGASAHFFVDEKEIVSSVPLSMSAGHCGVDYSIVTWTSDGAASNVAYFEISGPCTDGSTLFATKNEPLP